MEERKMSEKEAMELIARSLEAQRRKLSFVRSTLSSAQERWRWPSQRRITSSGGRRAGI